MQEVNTGLLDRIRSALRREQSISVGLAAEIVEQTKFLSRLFAEEREAQRRAAAWPSDSRLTGLSGDERAEAVRAGREWDAGQLDARRVAERVAGRPAVTEQATLAAVAEAARAGGVSPAVAVEVFVRSAARPDRQAIQASLDAATAARQRAEGQLRELEVERTLHGRKAGAYRATLQEAQKWMEANGLAMEAAA